DEGEQAFPLTSAPCQGQPDRPHLRLVSGPRSDEAKAPGSEPAAREPMLEPGASEEPPVEQLTYEQIASRGGGSPEAARHRVARRNLPRTRGSDGKTFVAVSPQDLLSQPPSARSPDGERPVNARSPVLPIEPEPRAETVPPSEPAHEADAGDRAGAATVVA